MKAIFIISLLFWNICAAQVADKTDSLQKILNDPSVGTVYFKKGSVLVNGTLNIPDNKVLHFENGSKIIGKGIINGGSIDAGYQSFIFDTTVTVNPKSVNQFFSVKWFGANDNNTDNSPAIQKSINTCIKNNIRTVFIPVGRYKVASPLLIRGDEGIKEAGFCTIELLGESSFWDSNTGSELHASFNNAFVIGIQNGKGCKVRKLSIFGQFSPPNTNDQNKFYNTSFADFKDGKTRDSKFSPYAAIVIDPFTNLKSDPLPADGGYPGLKDYYGKANSSTTQTGSTGIEIDEIKISGFVVGICSAPNGLTRNAEITIINKIQFENCKLCISGGQDQEKGNVISNIYCWGATHTIFATGLYGAGRMAGNWNIDHANIAGMVVRFIYNDQHGYFPTYISHVFAESLGTWGTINSELSSEISDCHIDFAYKNIAGDQNLLTSKGNLVVYRNCNFRYYGENTPLKMEGNCIFEYCYFSGKPIVNGNATFVRCNVNGTPLEVSAGSHNWLTLIQYFVSAILLVALIALIFPYIKKNIKARRGFNKKDLQWKTH